MTCRLLFVCVFSVILAACGGGGGGSDNGGGGSSSGGSSSGGSSSGGSSSGGSSSGGDGTGVSALLHGIEGFYAAPSLVQVLFQAFDEDGEPQPGLTLSDFTITNDGTDITNSEESLAAIAPATGLGFTLPTVFALDVSASVSDAEIKEAVSQLRNALLEEVETGSGEGETELRSKLLEGQQVAIVIYDGNINLHMSFTRNVALIDQALANLTNFERASREDNGSTALYEATRYSISLWEESFTSASIVRGYAVIISDGNDEASPGDRDMTIEYIQDSGKSVFTIPTSTDASQLDALASDPEYALETTGFDELGEELTSISSQIRGILDAIYVLEFSPPRRDGERYELGITYSSGVGEPTIRGIYDSSVFDGAMPAELRINAIPVAQSLSTLSSTIINLQPGESLEMKATTRWKRKDQESAYSWAESNSAGAVSLDATSGEAVTLTANEIGSEYITVTDENVQVGAGNLNQVSEVITFYVSKTDVSASNLHIAPGENVTLVAASSAENSPNFQWASSSGTCRLSAMFGEEITVNSSSSTYGYCGITVTDTANGSSKYYIPMTYGRQGTPISLSSEQPVASSYDFESGTIPDQRFNPWAVVPAGNSGASTSSNGNYVLQAEMIGHGESTAFEFSSVAVGSISFDYAVSSEEDYDLFEFYIDDVRQLSESGQTGWRTFTSGAMSGEFHTFTWVYIKDASESENSDTVWVDNIEFE